MAKKLEGKTELQNELEKSMFDLAVGKVYVEEIKTIIDPNTGSVIRVEKTRKQIPPNANVQQFLAKNLIPKKYHPLYFDNGGGYECRENQSVHADLKVARN